MNAILFASLCTLLCLFGSAYAANTFPDTTDGFHWFLVFDTPILNAYMANGATIDASPYQLVWGASDRLLPMYVQSNPNIVRTYYMPYERDVDVTRDLAYWKANHPDWIVYQCDKTTPAYMPGEPQRVPLDISNPAVIDWQVSTYSASARWFGYDGIAADNYALGNALSACGVYDANGNWVAKYSGQWTDPVFASDAIYWLSNFYLRLKNAAPELLFGINFSLNDLDPTDARVATVFANIDYLVDESGFTQWGGALPDPTRWTNIATMIETLQTNGKHYFGINEFPAVSPAAKEWAMASYLMCKNAHSSMVVTAIQSYGNPTDLPEYDALNVGAPLGERTLSNGLYVRQYSNGLVLFNPFTTAATYSISDASWRYADVQGNTYSSSAPITVAAQTGIVMGAVARPPTTTVASTATVAGYTYATHTGNSNLPAGNGEVTTGGVSQGSNPDAGADAQIKKSAASTIHVSAVYVFLACAAAIATIL